MFCCISLSKSCLYFCFAQCFLHPRSAGTLKLGQRVGAFATRPWQRRRGSVALTGRAVAPRSCSQESGSNAFEGPIVPGPGVQCWVLNWFCLVSWDPFLTHQRCGPCCGTLVCECNGDIDDLYTILNKLSIFHIILFESIMLYNKTRDAHLFVMI